jgi:restriction endonuclease
VFGVAWRRLNEELVAPRIERLERVGVRHVEHEYAAIRAAIERHAKRLKALLTRRIPYLHMYFVT